MPQIPTDGKFQNDIPQNPLDDEKKKSPQDLQTKVYTEEDKVYLSFLQERLENSKRMKDQTHPEFNGKTYYQVYEDNEKIANTHHLDPKKNPDDVVVSAGTIESKLDALLSNINNLNLEVEVLAFDKNNNKINDLGNALNDIIHDTEIRDGGDGAGDEEKKIARQRELLKQGTVFVQEEWVKKFETKKKLTEKYNGQFKDFKGWTSKLEKVFEGPSRTLLHGPNVFLGDITEFDMENQPYMFVVIHQDYDIAKRKYGKFENWQYVHKGKVTSEGTSETPKTIFDNKWRLTELKKNQVEIILYQDQPGDEFQILINGVLLLPIGFPLSAVVPGGQYNVTKQVYRLINNKFAYGSSFVSSGSIKELSALIDEMLKLFVLKTRKSFTPAYVNTSGRVIDRKVLSPGRISMGFDAGSLTPIAGNEVQGVTAGEVSVLKEMQDLINKSTVSDNFQGQQSSGRQTATEVVETQRQAKLTLGLTIVVCTLLEKKLGFLRLYNVLANWFEPTDERVQKIGEARELVKVFRRTTRDVAIDGEGEGERSVIPQDSELPTPEVVRGLERDEEEKKGFPVRKIFLSPKILKTAKLTWYVVVNASEKESSPFFKLLFREQLTDIITMMQFGSKPNIGGLEEEFARVWKTPRSKIFEKSQISPDMAGVSSAEEGGGGIRTPQQQSQAQGRPDNAGGGLPAAAGAGLGG